MKIQLLSDLHLESDPDFQARPAPGADLLVLAGDIGSYQDRSRLMETDFGLGRFSPARGWPAPVVYVPGNHEYDNLDFDETHDRLRELCHALDIHWLERETRVMQGVRLVGTTLWTDFDALAQPDEELGSVLKKRAKAFRAADFYLAKAGMRRHGEPFMAEQMREQGIACQQWLDEALRQPFDGVTVVITHFAPTLASADPRYGVTPGTAGFCNTLDALLPRADYWLHGHLHCALDYMKDGCRVIANPLGYEKKGERENFAPARTWDVRTGEVADG
ncbi:metallophosphoesterase [Achromobacter sp. AONIH1]|uniref:metallophosphoesterase n=1 Tax=Achromobacter sp. AONIH1 TaxID=1758194 RepID=UPI000CD1A964|nr:metallophosphoesterase [Achromobacter sp. AONIH1]AUT49765.1 metallophosphoesterase [Achromobacter sp. AONIH1]